MPYFSHGRREFQFVFRQINTVINVTIKLSSCFQYFKNKSFRYGIWFADFKIEFV